MELKLILFTSIILVSIYGGQATNWMEHCHGKPCPEYMKDEKDTTSDYEVHWFIATEWLTTSIDSQESPFAAVLKANKRLEEYCTTQKDAGFTICDDTWPVLISSTGNPTEYTLSWFIRPNATKPETIDDKVKIVKKGPSRFYVSNFSGVPSFARGVMAKEKLRKALEKNRKEFEPKTYIGASYDRMLSVTHYNEVWIN